MWTREKANQYKKEWRRNMTLEQREKLNAYKRGYNRNLSGVVRENRDRFVREYKKHLTEEQKEKYNETQRRRRKNLSEHCRRVAAECSRKWHKSHPRSPEKRRLGLIRYRARKTEAGGFYTLKEWRELLERFGHTCLSCLRKEPDVKLEGDHVVPVSKGGSTFIDNIQPLCGSCNKRKSNKTIDFRIKFVAAAASSIR